MAKKKLLPIKDRVENYLISVLSEIPTPGKRNGDYVATSCLHSIFVWQVIAKMANSRLKKAWESAQPELVPADDDLRDRGEGDYIYAEAGPYSASVRVSQGRMMFSKDLFIEAVAKEYKIDQRKLMALSEGCYSRTRRSVEKRVIEVVA